MSEPPSDNARTAALWGWQAPDHGRPCYAKRAFQHHEPIRAPRCRVILTVCYATGLRISEAVRLKPSAIDSKRMVIRVEQGEGRKDHYVMLPPLRAA
jgi:integrase